MQARVKIYPWARVMALFSCLVGVAAWFLFTGETNRLELINASAASGRRPNGGPQLVSIEPLPVMEAEMCQWVPASASSTLLAALQGARAAATTSSVEGESRSTVDADRAPLRVIRDTYPTYSAVAVDTRYNEVFLLDENLFGLKVFNRLDNTPPEATFTEPKRVLGGFKTKLEFDCGLYIDPNTGDLYSVANDTRDSLVVFSRDAQGDVPPRRELETPHRTYGVAVDEETQELYLTVQYPPQVVVYHKLAAGADKPIRLLEGEHTGLEDAHGIAIDTKNGWMFISNHGSDSKWDVPGSGKLNPPSITVYPLNASGDTPPLRTIEGPKTRLNWPAAMAIDTDRGELFVANDADDSILVFRVNDSGNIDPHRVIKGSQAGLKNPTGIFLDAKNRELWVSNMGNHSATVYRVDATGNVAPLRTIRSAPTGKMALVIGNPGGVAFDNKRDEILVPN